MSPNGVHILFRVYVKDSRLKFTNSSMLNMIRVGIAAFAILVFAGVCLTESNGVRLSSLLVYF